MLRANWVSSSVQGQNCTSQEQYKDFQIPEIWNNCRIETRVQGIRSRKKKQNKTQL